MGVGTLSPMLIRQLLTWPTTPPPLLTRLAKLPGVQKDKSLQQLLLRHPNLPSQLKGGRAV
jgi:hypothetical protein